MDSSVQRLYIEQTIPTLHFTAWMPNQSDYSIASFGESEHTSEQTDSESELFSDEGNNVTIDLLSDSHEPVSIVSIGKVADEIPGGKICSSETIRTVMDSMPSGVEPWMTEDSKAYHKELPCFNVIIEHFDSVQKLQKDSIGSLLIKSDNTSDLLQKWHELPENEFKDFEKENISPAYGSPNPTKEQSPPPEHASQCDRLEVKVAEEKSGSTSEDLEKIKTLANRLKLQTRRGSYTTWKMQLSRLTQQSTQTADTAAKSSRGARWIKEKLDFIRSELSDLRQQDDSLARQFITLRNDIQQMRLQHSRWAVEDMVDEAQWTIAENEELEHVCDEPRKLDKSPLLTVGVTKMNLTERRFSVF